MDACIAERQLRANANKSERVEELDLISRSQRGDTSAFDVLVTRYSARIFGLVYGMVNNEDNAWDIPKRHFCYPGFPFNDSSTELHFTRGCTVLR